ncbi:hypothetical protein [Actinomadura fibrosa]|uniref:DUF1036 domain-containing protein n=1 Tax=Actinomadura fibrosa TaxID=111802 RepID=A0ABW2XGU9_9ACTN|nr:hypothetical protein [Actinomadura fibrosa]
MRKFVTAGLGIAALAATVGVAAPAAGAATTPAPHPITRSTDGFGGPAVSAKDTGKFHRIGYIHSFKAPAVKGATVWGHWYWARYGDGPGFVYLVTKVKDTRKDGKAAGFCYYLKGPDVDVRDYCYVNTKGYNKTLRIAGEIDNWNKTTFRVQAGVGVIKNNLFYTSAVGRWLKVH